MSTEPADASAKLEAVLGDFPAPSPAADAPPSAPESAPAPAPVAEPSPAPADTAPKDAFVEPLLTGDEEPAPVDGQDRDEKGRFKTTEDKPAADEPRSDAPKDDPAKDKAADPAKDEPKDDKPTEAEQPKQDAPYEVKLPEGVAADSLDKPTFDKFVSVVKDGGLKAEKATELVAMHQAELGRQAEVLAKNFDKDLRTAITTFQKGWRDETLGDEKLGGNRINTTIGNVRQIIARYGGTPAEQKALYADLKSTGMGVNLRLTRLLHNVFSDVMREGGPAGGNQGGGQSPSRELGDVLFG